MARVLADTNVLFPFSLMDLMLALSQDRIHTLLWSDRLLDEWERVIVREQHRSPTAAAAITRAIRDYFPENRVPDTDYKDLLATLEGPDPDDLHHMAAAAAAAGRAGTLITWNLGDFPQPRSARSASPPPIPTLTCAPCSNATLPRSPPPCGAWSPRNADPR
jgi:predicted nucleic acid-binding protein